MSKCGSVAVIICTVPPRFGCAPGSVKISGTAAAGLPPAGAAVPAARDAAAAVPADVAEAAPVVGAWVAGFRAGYVSNSWPDMNGHFVPEGIDWSRGTAFALAHDP